MDMCAPILATYQMQHIDLTFSEIILAEALSMATNNDR